jgi:hypothetical protein
MDQANFIEKIANKITDLGLTAPAIFLLEANKPLAFVGSQALLVAQPTLDIFLPDNFIRNVAELLADPTQLNQLITSLEASTPQGPKSREAGL